MTIEPAAAIGDGADHRDATSSSSASAERSYGILVPATSATTKEPRVPRATTGFDPEQLRALRTAAGLTHDALAAKLGTDRSAVIQWEKGRRAPSATTIRSLAQELGVEVERLLITPASSTIAHLRARAGLSQAEAARLADMTRTSYSHLERGERVHLDDVLAARLAHAFGVPTRDVQRAWTQTRSGTSSRT